MTDLPLDDEHDDEEQDDDTFIVTGKILVESGLSPEGELQWRFKYDDIEPALALGFLEVMKDEIKEDIRSSVEKEDDD